ncbi:MAG TPA: glycosyltransferase, partial [Acetobacteraceae bacterium]|nr:glycosyltransferase [Acetobacteraceae bacterium]
GLTRRIEAIGPQAAICAMPAPLDLLMARALRRLRIPFAVVIHDAETHPGDGLPLQMRMQRRLARQAAALVALSPHVAARLREDGLAPRQRLLLASHPPFDFGPMPPARGHEGPLRLLFFGRLLRYKGLDLLAAALARLPPGLFTVRVVGRGPASPARAALAALGFVTVENRWVPEEEIPALLGWADAVVLPYREASQSGVAAGALAAGRFVVATRVGGLEPQLGAEPLARLAEPDPASLAACLARLAGEPAPPMRPASSSAEAAWSAFGARLLSAFGASPAPPLAAPGPARHDDADLDCGPRLTSNGSEISRS